jgi:hypothetical protein
LHPSTCRDHNPFPTQCLFTGPSQPTGRTAFLQDVHGNEAPRQADARQDKPGTTGRIREPAQTQASGPEPRRGSGVQPRRGRAAASPGKSNAPPQAVSRRGPHQGPAPPTGALGLPRWQDASPSGLPDLPAPCPPDQRPISGYPSGPSGKSASSVDLGSLGLTGRGGRAAQKRRSPRRCARSGAVSVLRGLRGLCAKPAPRSSARAESPPKPRGRCRRLQNRDPEL